MKRLIDKRLLAWKKDPSRKVLLLRGARQVGKTFSVRQLGKTFDDFFEINFEENKDIHQFFLGSLDPAEINKKLSAYFGRTITPQKTLLFFDEVQACPDAIRALRFYYEKMPQLHLIAAGSLLEFALSEIPTFGVGRIFSLFMYPLCFAEYLWAVGETRLHQMILESSAEKPVDPVLHQKLLEHFRAYQILGGMPEVIKTYVEKNDYLVCQEVIDTLIKTLFDDFAKYKKRVSVLTLRETFESVVRQVSGKFKFTNISDRSSSKTHGDALELLVLAGLVHRVVHTAAQGIPLGAQAKLNKFKALVFDVGLYHRILGLSLSEHLLKTPVELINKGSAAELFVGLELLVRLETPLPSQLYYWHRESPSSNAEVDYIIQKQGAVLPLEVKAGTKGQMQSLHVFLEEHRHCLQGLRISHENFAHYKNIVVVPIYAVEKIFLRALL